MPRYILLCLCAQHRTIVETHQLQLDHVSVTFLPPYKTGSPLPRVAHRHFDPQCTVPLLASFSERQNLHVVLRDSCADVPVTVFHQSWQRFRWSFSWLCQSLNRGNSGRNPRQRARAYRLQELLRLLCKVGQLHQKPRLRESLRPLSILASGVPRTTPWPLRGSSHLIFFQRVPRSLRYHAWNCGCSGVLSWVAAVVKASVVSDAVNRRKTCAT